MRNTHMRWILALLFIFNACGDDAPAGIDKTKQPTATISGPVSAKSGEMIALDGSRSSDPLGGSLTYRWSQLSGSGVILSSFDSEKVSFNAPATTGSIRFQLIVTNALYDSEPATIEIAITNEKPVAHAGDDQRVAPNSIVTLHGSTDDTYKTITYKWTQLSGESVTLSSDTDSHPTFKAPDKDGELEFSLVVSDGELESSADSVKIIVDSRPIADAGRYQRVASGATVTLDGSGSSDTGQGALSYQWTQMSGTTVSFDDATLDKPSFTAPTENVTLVFQLIVSDASAQSAPDTVEVEVVLNQPPVVDAGGNKTILNLSTLSLSGSATDPEQDSITDWLWEVTSYPTGGDNYQLTGEHSANASFTPLVKGNYTLSLKASDKDGWSDPDTITVYADNNLPVANAGPDVQGFNNSPIKLAGSAVDLDGDSLTYQWSVTSSPQGATSNFSDATKADALFTPNKKGSYILQLVVNDGDDPSTPVSVKVEALNNAPLVEAGAAITSEGLGSVALAPNVSDADNDPLTYSWSLLSTSPLGLNGNFSDSSTLNSSFTPQAYGEYRLLLQVNDGEAAPQSDIVVVRITKAVTEQSAIFVSKMGTDANGCGSKSAPCASLSYAIKEAQANNKDMIAIAGGDYSDPHRSILLPPGMKVFGGYNATTWNRDLAQEETILRPATPSNSETGSELSDGVDNDCDGFVDNIACIPSGEICDNKDNDCDGKIDNDDEEQSSCGDSFEVNEGPYTAKPLGFNTRYKGMTVVLGDSDYFSFSAPNPPSKGDDWYLTVAFRCVDNCSLSTTNYVEMQVYKDSVDSANSVFIDRYDSNDKHPLLYQAAAGTFNAGTYYIRVEKFTAGQVTYQLDIGYMTKQSDTASTNPYNLVPTYCRDAYVIGIENAVSPFNAGDENIISGLTIYGQADDLSTSIPMVNWRDNYDTSSNRNWGSTIYCDACALTLEDCTIHTSQIKRREISANGMDASAGLAVNAPKTLPIKIERNHFNLGQTALSAGVAFYDTNTLIIRENSFSSNAAKSDTGVKNMRMIWGNFYKSGGDTLIVDQNIFNLETTSNQTSCTGFYTDKTYYSDAPALFAPLYITNNVLIASGACTSFKGAFMDLSMLSKTQHPPVFFAHNSFYGTGNGIALQAYSGHHGSSPVAVVNNIIDGFAYGLYSNYFVHYVANNAFNDTTSCAYVYYYGYNCKGQDCGTCISDHFCENHSTCATNPGAWASKDNRYVDCSVIDRANDDYSPSETSLCIDAGDMSQLPSSHPPKPTWLAHDLNGQKRPYDHPTSNCPSQMSCDQSDIGAFEYH